MGTPEATRTKIIDTTNQTLTNLTQSKDVNVRQLTTRVGDRIRSREIYPAPASAELATPGLTGFGLQIIKGDDFKTYRPAFILNYDNLADADPSDTKVQADFFRTLTIMDAFPDNGYEGRLVDLYDTALTAEARMAGEGQQATDFASIEAAMTKRTEAIKAHLGNTMYYTDTGWGDFLDALRKEEQKTPHMKEPIAELRNDTSKKQFFILRAGLAEMAYDALQTLPGYETFTHDKRATITAELYVDYIMQRIR